MSTLMHLPGDGIEHALRELRRVIRPGGLLEVGVWGADSDGARIDDRGRYFRHRTDRHLQELVAEVGNLLRSRPGTICWVGATTSGLEWW